MLMLHTLLFINNAFFLTRMRSGVGSILKRCSFLLVLLFY